MVPKISVVVDMSGLYSIALSSMPAPITSHTGVPDTVEMLSPTFTAVTNNFLSAF